MACLGTCGGNLRETILFSVVSYKTMFWLALPSRLLKVPFIVVAEEKRKSFAQATAKTNHGHHGRAENAANDVIDQSEIRKCLNR